MAGSNVLSSLADWLRNPRIVIRVAHDTEVQELQTRCADLEAQLTKVRSLYAEESIVSMRYADMLRDHGIPLK